MRRVVTLLLIIVALAVNGQSRPVSQPSRQVVELSADDVSVTVDDGYIVITLPRQAQVKIFTILGQPVMTTNLGAGTSRLRLPARGSYILKIGTITKRITL